MGVVEVVVYGFEVEPIIFTAVPSTINVKFEVFANEL